MTIRKLSTTGLSAAILMLAGCTITTPTKGGQPIGQPPSGGDLGLLGVKVGFGAVSATPYQCQGSGQLTLTSATHRSPPPQSYRYGGFSSTVAPPACSQSVTFTDLPTGTWTLADSGGARCQVTINAGYNAITLRTEGGCQ